MLPRARDVADHREGRRCHPLGLPGDLSSGTHCLFCIPRGMPECSKNSVPQRGSDSRRATTLSSGMSAIDVWISSGVAILDQYKRSKKISRRARVPAPLILVYASASFSITTLRCVVTSLCSLMGTVNSPRVRSASCNWILRRSRVKPFFSRESAMSLEVTDPKS